MFNRIGSSFVNLNPLSISSRWKGPPSCVELNWIGSTIQSKPFKSLIWIEILSLEHTLFLHTISERLCACASELHVFCMCECLCICVCRCVCSNYTWIEYEERFFAVCTISLLFKTCLKTGHWRERKRGKGEGVI